MQPKYPFNDWSKTPPDLLEWANDIREQARVKFGVDTDGDCPVQIRVLDRTKFEAAHWFDVPYEHEAETEEQLYGIETALMLNLQTAMRSYEQFLRLRRDRRFRQ